jgi:hypothetical protein
MRWSGERSERSVDASEHAVTIPRRSDEFGDFLELRGIFAHRLDASKDARVGTAGRALIARTLRTNRPPVLQTNGPSGTVA